MKKYLFFRLFIGLCICSLVVEHSLANESSHLSTDSPHARIISSWNDAYQFAKNCNDNELASTLLKNDPHAPFDDHMGGTLLSYVARQGYDELFHFLLRAGGSIKEKNEIGTTLLMWASSPGKDDQKNYEGNFRIIDFLLESGFKVNEQSENKMTPFLVATLYGPLEIMKYLVEKGADPKMTAKNGESSLHFAVMANDEEKVEYLLSLVPGMINHRTKWGDYPLDFAKSKDNRHIIRLLRRYGAKADAEHRDEKAGKTQN